MTRPLPARRWGPAACCLALGLLSPSAMAITCSIVDTTPVSFGTYDVFSGTALDSTGDVTVHCTSVGVSDLVEIELSTGAGASYAPRTLARAGGGELNYNLYLNAGRSVVWGDGTGSTSVVGPYTPPDDADDVINIYGRVPAGQDVEGGVYSDTVVVTINY